jgi:hypothetical protein
MGFWVIRVVLRRITLLLLPGHIDPKDGRALGRATPYQPRRTAGIGAKQSAMAEPLNVCNRIT